ncbi:MAG TPA: M50 family metallopeptidase [Streptosporangiaceae bacterium]|jgi:hypothetical protein
MTPAQQRQFDAISAELNRLIRYDDESVVHEHWIRQRYDGGYAQTYRPARTAAVETAWHEAGHAVAALVTGARFSSASIRHSATSAGRVHAITTGGSEAFVIHAAGQIAERLRGWTTLDDDAGLTAWLRTWRDDGGDAKHFRDTIKPRSGTAAEVAAWRYAERVLTPHRPQIRHLARALLVYPRYLPYEVSKALYRASLYQAGNASSESRTTSAPAR